MIFAGRTKRRVKKDDYVIQVAPTVAKLIGFFRPYLHLQQHCSIINLLCLPRLVLTVAFT